MPPTIIPANDQNTINIVAIRPFRHNGAEVPIGKKVEGILRSEGLHIISCKKAVMDGPGAEEAVKQAKASAEAVAKLHQANNPIPGAAGKPVDVKALVNEITKAVREELAAEMKETLNALKSSMADEIKTQVAAALPKK